MRKRSYVQEVFYVLISLMLIALLSACTSKSSTPSGVINVVAAENFYGDIVSQLGGSHVSVTSIIKDPSADPHTYESNSQNVLAISKAKIVIEKGIGYDNFMGKILSSAPKSGRLVLVVSKILGVGKSDVNPHVWYDPQKIRKVASAISAKLISVVSVHKTEYEFKKTTFDSALDTIDTEIAHIKTTFPQAPVIYTERVPGYLLDAAGLKILTPPAFAQAIENGNDPSTQSTNAMEQLITKRTIKVLLYNSQATSPITQHVRDLAGQNKIPVVGVTETLPSGENYQQWQLNQIHKIEAALATS